MLKKITLIVSVLFLLNACDGNGGVSKTIKQIANAGDDTSLIEGETLVLQGSASDADATDTLTYSWSPNTNLDNANIAQPTFTAPAVTTDTQLVYTLTVNDGTVDATDTITLSVLNLPSQPQNVQAVAGDAQITLTWDAVTDATGYDICQATETITTPNNCAVYQGGSLISNSTSPVIIDSLSNGTDYFFAIIPKNSHGDGIVSAVVTARPIVQPTPTGKLNDTGITLCGDYAYGGSDNHSNSEDCANTTDADGDPIPAGQDGHSGRDVTHNDDNDGHAGFSFTKISSTGAELPASATQWSCVKDNVTGLIWEVKTTDGGLHDKNNTYTWYNPDSATNGGNAGTENGDNDTDSFVTNTNNAGYCGAHDWRMPNREELKSLVDYGIAYPGPTIDTAYFPNAASAVVWSSSPSAYNSDYAWVIYFYFGNDYTYVKSNYRQVRLVRSGQ